MLRSLKLPDFGAVCFIDRMIQEDGLYVPIAQKRAFVFRLSRQCRLKQSFSDPIGD
jgi:hypothetical protein